MRRKPLPRRTLLAGALVGAGLFLTGGVASGEGSVAQVVTGTAHQALFGLATQGDVAVAVGAAGEILESSDAGKNWKAVNPAPTPLSLLGVALNQGHAIAVGQEGTVLVMNVAGKWVKASSGTDNRLFNVSVNAAGRAVAVGAFGTILLSNDGGQTWNSIAPQDWTGYSQEGEQPHLYDASVDDKGVATVVGEFGLVLRTADAGKTWQILHKGDASLFALRLFADGSGYAVGQNGAALHTADGGKTWQDIDVGTKAILLGVQAGDNGKVLISGMHDMLISSDQGKTWSHVGDADASSSWFQGVASVGSTQDILAVGHSGKIVKVVN